MKYFKPLVILALSASTLLVILGGVVHNTGSSLACPDWPLCFGQVFPKMEGQVAIEHSHRLLATFVGLCMIGLVLIGSGFRKKRPDLFRASLIGLALVIFQGVLGGATVLLKLSPIISTLHLATSQIFLGLLLWLMIHSFDQNFGLKTSMPSEVRGYLKWAVLFVFVQMCLGALIRHGGASVACGLGPNSALLCVEHENFGRSFWPTLGLAQLHMLHRYLGLITGAVVVGTSLPVLKWARSQGLKPLRLWIVSSHALWLLQVVLGVLSLTTYLGPVSVTAHLGCGMLLWLNVLGLFFLVGKSCATA